MNRKGYIPPLAFALLVLFGIIIVMTIVPEIRNTAIDMLKVIFE